MGYRWICYRSATWLLLGNSSGLFCLSPAWRDRQACYHTPSKLIPIRGTHRYGVVRQNVSPESGTRPAVQVKWGPTPYAPSV